MDEVLSSLRWSIITHNLTDTAFWTIELFESNLIQECIELLETIWLYHIGFGSWFALRLILYTYEAGDINQANLLAITCAFAKRRLCDSTVFHLLLRGAIANKKPWVPAFPHTTEYHTVQQAVLDCLKRGKLQEAWLLGRALTEEEQWTLLEGMANELGRSDELLVLKELRECRQESLASSYILVSLDHISWMQSQEVMDNTIPREVQSAIEEWNALDLSKSMRKRRAIKPKPEALLLTARSKQTPYESSEPQIQDGLLHALRDSEYWSGILEPYMNGDKWKTQRHKELFYDTHFPQEIPDEWSLADREQSHGRGLGKSEEQARARFIQLTLQHSKSLELWNSRFPNGFDCSMDWTALYSSRPIFSLPMKPVKKVFEII
uniref:Uncharacterized protein n=1 Tax=viral metagenome TaxID=1070528 RepID=A0A6C0AP60_9ZZZZ